MAGRYLVRTFGCQMNEHDSERIAGLLEADGMTAVDDAGDADVVVLNTCCIRENADNKLYGTLGHLKSLKDANPDLRIMVGGCLAQKDRGTIQARAPHVDVVFGTHNVGRAVELLHEAEQRGPLTEILEESDAFPSALPVRREVDWAAWVTIQIGCDNRCAFCIVPSVRGKEISRPLDEIVAEVADLAADGVIEITLLGQNVNSYGRDLTRRRPLFAELLRAVGSVDGIRRVRYTSPHPKDLRPDTIEAMAGTPAVCEHLHLPLQSGSDRVLAAMHRGYTGDRYLEKLTAARAGVPDLAVTTDLIVGFPGETDADFERTLEVVAAAEYDSAYTFVFSPRPGTEAATMTDRLVPAEVTAERFDRLRVVVERSALAKHEGRVGRVEEVVVEGPSRKDPSVTSGRTRQNKLVHFVVAERLRPGTVAEVRVTSAAPHHLRGELVAVTAPPTHRTRIPVTAGTVPGSSVGVTVALVGATASGKTAIAMEVARTLGDVEIVSVDSMQVYRGLDIGTAKPTAAERAEVRHHLLDLAEVTEEFSVAELQVAATAARADIAAWGRRALLVGGTGLYLRVVLDDLDLPGRYPAVRAELALEPDTAALHARLAALDPRAADRMTPGNRRRIERALEVSIGSGRPFSSYGPGLDVYPPGAPAQVGIEVPLDRLDERIGVRVAAMLDAGLLEEVRRLDGRPLSRTVARALGYVELGDHLAGRCSLDEAVAAIVRRTRRLARRQLRWFRRDPRIVWVAPGDAVCVVIDRLADDPQRCVDHQP